MKSSWTTAAMAAGLTLLPVCALAQEPAPENSAPLAAGASAAEVYAREVNALRVRSIRTLTLISIAQRDFIPNAARGTVNLPREVLCDPQGLRYHGLDAPYAARMIGQGVAAFSQDSNTTMIDAVSDAFGPMPDPTLEPQGELVIDVVEERCVEDLARATQTGFGRTGGTESGLVEGSLALIAAINKLKPAVISSLDFVGRARRAQALRRWVQANDAEIQAVTRELNALADGSIVADAPVRRLAAYDYLTELESFAAEMQARDPLESIPEYRVVDASLGAETVYARPAVDGSLSAVLEAAERYDSALDASLTAGDAYRSLGRSLSELRENALSGASMAEALASFQQFLQILNDLSAASQDEDLQAAIDALNEAL